MSVFRPTLPRMRHIVFFLLSQSSATTLPYNPTHLFYSTQNDSNLLYSLQPSSSTSPKGQLQSLQIGGPVNVSNPSYTTVSASLPFLQDTSLAYIPSVDPNGGISVYTGECSNGANSSQLWRFTADAKSPDGHGSWSQEVLSFSATSSQGSSQIGPNFLATSISFSPTTLEKDTSVYIFGGMCPDPSIEGDSWQSSASYSNQMLVFQPGKDEEIDYTLVPSRGQPIAEAGFTITALQPIVSNTSTGVKSQQQNFLLLGGHTGTAFINMSQVAVFSLPQNVWTFVPVQQPADALIEPRSGHTALLSGDSSKIVVIGGWVANTTNAASPPIAFLHVGEGYGGTGTWSWSEPSLVDSPFEDGSGLFGHGSVMLPGNILMISGGYTIPKTSAKHKRAAPSASPKTYFYNVSSNSWLTTYPGVNSRLLDSMSQAEESTGPLSTASQKVGLGAGLPLGLAAVGCAIFFAYIYWRRTSKKRQEVKERQMRERDVYNHHAGATAQRDMEINPFDDHYRTNIAVIPPPSAIMRGPAATPAPASTSFGSMRSAERSGLDLNLPSPSRGLRKGRYYSGQFSDAPTSSTDKRMSRASTMASALPTFDEREELEDDALTPMLQRPTSDPFVDPIPPLNVKTSRVAANYPRPMSPQEERQQEMASWVSDWESAAQTLHSPSPPPSPSRSEDGFVRRKALAYDYLDVNKPRNGLVSGSIKRARRSPRPEHQRHSRETSHTERDGLLDGPGSIKLDPDTAPTFTSGDPNSKRTSSKIGSLLGSVRRNVSGAVGRRGAGSSTTPYNSQGFSGVDVSMIEPYTDNPSSATASDSSPTKESWRSSTTGTVKRSVSNPSSAPWAAKKGAQDWATDETRARAMTMSTRDSLDWDPEEAVKDRAVQLMFTVPRGQLRVVNADVDKDSISDVSGKAVEREDDLHSVSVYSPRVGVDGWESMDQGLR